MLLFCRKHFLFSKIPFVNARDRVFLLSYRTGHLGLLSKDGDIEKQYTIIQEYHDQQVKETLNHNLVILGCAVSQDGSILMACRTPKGVFNSQPATQLVDKHGQVNRDALFLRKDLNPEDLDIVWHELRKNGETFELIKDVSPPVNAPMAIESFEHPWNTLHSIPFIITWDHRFQSID